MDGLAAGATTTVRSSDGAAITVVLRGRNQKTGGNGSAGKGKEGHYGAVYAALKETKPPEILTIPT